MVILGYLWVCHDFGDGESVQRVEFEQVNQKVSAFVAQEVGHAVLAQQNQLVELSQSACFEGDRSHDHGLEHHAQRPDVAREACLAFVRYYFWRYLGRSAALLSDHCSYLHDFRYSKITNLNVVVFV